MFMDADSVCQDEAGEFEEESDITSLSSSVLDYEYEKWPAISQQSYSNSHTSTLGQKRLLSRAQGDYWYS